MTDLHDHDLDLCAVGHPKGPGQEVGATVAEA